MPTIRSVATTVPPYLVPQDVVREMARAHFAPTVPNIDRYLPVFRHAQIDSRAFAAPPEWFTEQRSFKECNDLFIEVAGDLSEHAARQCLADAGLAPADVDMLIFVSTTGMAAPSLDARLINRLGMSQHTRRTPIWGLGCAGGVAGLSRAWEYTTAFPAQRALLINAELCSVTFQWNDHSKRNIIASSLFADGVTAVLVEGDECSGGGPTILGTSSTLWPDTLDVMGWDMIDTGMQVVFSARIPGMVQSTMRATIESFLAPYDLAIDDIDHWVLHPGGAKVVRAYEEALQVDPERLDHTRAVLRQYGNMSSATVFFVLKAFLDQGAPGPGEYALLAVLGPGFSCELALVQG